MCGATIVRIDLCRLALPAYWAHHRGYYGVAAARYKEISISPSLPPTTHCGTFLPSGHYVTHAQVQAATEQTTKSRTPASQVHLYDREEKFYEICIYPRPRRNIDSSSYSLTWWPREDRDVGLGEVRFGTLIIFRKLCRKGVWVRMGLEGESCLLQCCCHC